MSIIKAPINFNKAELSYFEQLFNSVSIDGKTASSAKIVPLFRTSHIPNSLLKEVWLKSATDSNI